MVATPLLLLKAAQVVDISGARRRQNPACHGNDRRRVMARRESAAAPPTMSTGCFLGLMFTGRQETGRFTPCVDFTAATKNLP